MRSIALVSVLAMAACGKSKDSPPPPKPSRPAPVMPAPPAPAPTPPTPAAAPTPPPPPAPDLGACELSASGAVTGHDLVPRNRASVLTDYWLGDTERAQIKATTSGATAQMASALKLLTLNCEGSTIRMSIVPGASASTKTIPFAARTYQLVKGAGDLVVLAHVGDELLVNPTGTIDITAFDAHHIAATIDPAGTTMDKREVKLAGKLDYLCNGVSGCK